MPLIRLTYDSLAHDMPGGRNVHDFLRAGSYYILLRVDCCVLARVKATTFICLSASLPGGTGIAAKR